MSYKNLGILILKVLNKFASPYVHPLVDAAIVTKDKKVIPYPPKNPQNYPNVAYK